MNPFYFGSSARPLFGMYASPAERSPVLGAVVLCQPLGSEYINAHRAVRQLALMLSEAGFHTLRFDYYGTGDSGGESENILLDDLVQDIGLAIDELCSMSGAARVRLVGLRFAGSLVARAAAVYHNRVEAVVLWDPVVSGVNHIEEFALDGRPANRQSEFYLWSAIRRRGSMVPDSLCFPMNATMVSQVRSTKLRDLAKNLPSRTFVVTTGLSDELASVRDALATAPMMPGSFENYPGFPCWSEDWPIVVAAVPVKAITRIVGWMKEI